MRGAIGGLTTAARRGRAPHRPAGLPTLERLEVADPSRAAHVGDNRGTDVAGALGLGMTGRPLHRVAARADERFPEATHVIAGLAELPRGLGF